MDNPFSDSPSKVDNSAPQTSSLKPQKEGERFFKHLSEEASEVTPAPAVSQTLEPTAIPKEEMKEVERRRGKEKKNGEELEVIIKETPKRDEGDDLLIENDGNVFWIFQKIVWSFLKIVLIVVVIGLLIWIIWRPGKNPLNKIHHPSVQREMSTKEEKNVVPEEKKVKKVESDFIKTTSNKKAEISVETKETPITKILAENYAYKASLWADWMENTRQAQNAQILSQSLYWMKRAEGFLNLTAENLLASEDHELRAKNIDTTLGSLRGILEESKGIMMTLNSELNSASAQSRSSEAGMLEADRQLSLSIEVLDGDRAESFLAEKSRLYQDFVTQNAKVTTYYYTLNRVQSLIPPLQQIYDNILANRQVLIDNVHVVGFPQDKFHRILTPAEWQEGVK